MKKANLVLTSFGVLIVVYFVTQGGQGPVPLFDKSTYGQHEDGKRENHRQASDSAVSAVALSVESTASHGFHCGFRAYRQYAFHILRSTVGPVIAAAMYDPEMFNHVARRLASGEVDLPDTLVYDATMLRGFPVQPQHFNNMSNIIWHVKRLISLGIARWHRDQDLEAMLHHTCTSELSFRVYDQSMRRVVEAFAQYFHTVLQLGIDVTDKRTRTTWNNLLQKLGEDPLVLVAASVDHRHSVEHIDRVLQITDEVTLEANLKQLSSTLRGGSNRNGGAESRIESHFPLYYQHQPFDQQDPINGKFWNMIRPTATCSSFIRLCELPDGCKLLCNAEYLLFAGREGGPGIKPFPHRVVGFGCNNDYDWELSIERFFRSANQAHNGSTNTLGWVTVFDCTLTMTPGPRKFNPPSVLREANIGFGFAPLCLDGSPKGTTVLGPRQVKDFLLRSEREKRSSGVDQLTTRFSVSDRALAALETQHRQVRTVHPRAPAVRLFDAISIYKVDIEGYEFNVIPSWSREELVNIATGNPALVKKGAVETFDFEEAASDFMTISLFSMEFHRMGHKKAVAASRVGALRSHYLMLHLYSLGFLMVGHEKNQYDHCCYEQAWSHVRHFVRSETWMVTRQHF